MYYLDVKVENERWNTSAHFLTTRKWVVVFLKKGRYSMLIQASGTMFDFSEGPIFEKMLLRMGQSGMSKMSAV